MSRALFALTLLLALGAPGLRWAAGFAEAASGSAPSTKAGGQWDPNGAAAEAGSHWDPDGTQNEAGNMWDPNGAQNEAGNMWDPDG